MSNQSFLIFSIQGSLFAIDTHVVQEILWLPELTPIEEAPPDIVPGNATAKKVKIIGETYHEG